MRFPSTTTLLMFGVALAFTLMTPVGLSPLVAQQAPDAASSAVTIELGFDSTRVDGLFAADAAVPSEHLFGEALTLRSADGAGRVVLIGYRIRNGLIEAGYESPAFDAPGTAGAALAEAGGLPGTSFFEGVGLVASDGVADASWPVDATSGAGDPLHYIVSRTAGKPADWRDRAVVYAVVVPADPTERDGASVTPAVMFGEADARLGSSSTTTPSTSGPASTASGLLQQAAELEQTRNAWVQNYTLYRQIELMVVPIYYERDPAFSPLAIAGGAAPAVGAQGETGFRMMSPPQYMERWYEQAGMAVPKLTEEAAGAYDMTGQVMNEALTGEGLPGIGAAAEGMFGMMGMFIRAAAAVDPDSLMPQDLEGDVAAGQEFGRRATVVGIETVHGRRAHHLRATGLEDIELEQADGPSVILQAASLWLDERHLVPLRLVFDTEVMDKGKPQPITISLDIPKYAWAGEPGSSMLLPAVETMSITGLDQAMSDKDRAEMQKALAEVEKMKAEMEKMPAGVRGMMQGQIDRLEKMAGSGGASVFESVVITHHTAVNEGPPYPGGEGSMQIEGVLFPGALVEASWQEMTWGDDAGDEGTFDSPWYFLPETVSFTGVHGGAEGSLSVSGIPADLKMWGGFGTNAKTGPVEARVRLPDGTERSYRYERADLILNVLTPTQAWGVLLFEGGVARFSVGHMFCSTEPRALAVAASGGSLEEWGAAGMEVHRHQNHFERWRDVSMEQREPCRDWERASQLRREQGEE